MHDRMTFAVMAAGKSGQLVTNAANDRRGGMDGSDVFSRYLVSTSMIRLRILSTARHKEAITRHTMDALSDDDG